MTAVVIALLGSLALGLLGCGGPPKATRTALAITAAGVVAADSASAPLRSAKASECLELPTAAEYHGCMEAFDALELGLRVSREAHFSAQAALDAWEDGASSDTWTAIVPCLAASLTSLVVLLEDVGVPLPEEIRQGLGLVEAFGGTCR